MYIIALFGLLLMVLSTLMIISPASWANNIIKFSEWPYFHLFEIFSRLVFGAIFVKYSDQTLFPNIMHALGYLLVAVAGGLSLTPPSKHKQFAVWSAHKFIKIFRIAGSASLLFGAFLIYASLKNLIML